MTEIVALLKSPQFWIVSVIVGLLIGVGANALWRMIEKSLERRSVTLRRKAEHESRARQALLDRAIASPVELRLTEFRARQLQRINLQILILIVGLISFTSLTSLIFQSGAWRVVGVGSFGLIAVAIRLHAKSRKALEDVEDIIERALIALSAKRERFRPDEQG